MCLSTTACRRAAATIEEHNVNTILAGDAC